MTISTNALPREPSLSPKMCEQAMEWWLDMQEASFDSPAQAAFMAWRNEHPLHEAAWERALALGEQLNSLRTQGDPNLARQALLVTSREGLSRRRAIKGLALLLSASAATWMARDSEMVSRISADYATGVGEQRRVALASGVSVELNTRSALKARQADHGWHLRLLSGEVLVDTVLNQTLFVETAQVRAQASSARFTVRQFDNGSTQLAVYRGSLQVIPMQASTWASLQAGQQARFGPIGVLDQGALQAGTPAWAEGMIVANGQPLQAFLNELGRYRHGHLGCDSALANLQVWGTYPLADSDRIIDAVAQTLKLDVQRFTRLWVNLRPLAATV
ncbi:MAG: FecR domain-containing protein [Candidatus Pseudomonas phytovorans]|uniref:FecR domain-containing protein n=1 Tax=Candidatus Pseudomonas phytovorans TaxID=3121377 RepID=A0AAJ5WFA7_9PSED|nr:FecR domain-containing protein [Pseudomonas sp.]WEK29378.1 MAG: FecR domain-containing protein [Pseudomonas sp.]